MKSTISTKHVSVNMFIIIVFFMFVAPVNRPQYKPEPTAGEIFNMYIKACGGKAEFDKIKSRITLSVTEDDATKEKTEVKNIQAKPVKLYAEYKSGSLGNVISGTDGTTAWEISTSGKPRIKEGLEKEILLRECILDKYIYHEKIFKNVEAQGKANLGDKNYYKVIGTLFSGDTQTLYFDMQTHYLVKIEMKYAVGGKEYPVEQFLSQYKNAGKVLLPYRTQTHSNGRVKYTNITKITNNPKLPKTQFDLPKEIKKLKK